MNEHSKAMTKDDFRIHKVQRNKDASPRFMIEHRYRNVFIELRLEGQSEILLPTHARLTSCGYLYFDTLEDARAGIEEIVTHTEAERVANELDVDEYLSP